MELLQRVWEAIKRFVQVDTSVKIISLLLAMLLWLYVVTSNTYVYQIDLPVRVVNVPAGKTIANEIPQVVRARFRGTGVTYLKTMITRSYSDMSLRLDARRVQGETEFNLPDYIEAHPDNIILPRGLHLELVSIIQPESIRLELDDLGQKTLPVISRISIQTEPGYTLVGAVRIKPDSVTLEGPASQLPGVDSVRTGVVEIKQADDFVQGTVNLDIPKPRLFQASVRQVTYYGDVQTISERTLADIPVEVRNVPGRLTASTAPSTVSLTIEGGSQYIYNLTQADIQVYVDYAKQWNPRQNYYVPIVETPPDVLQWRDLVPKQVEIIVVRK